MVVIALGLLARAAAAMVVIALGLLASCGAEPRVEAQATAGERTFESVAIAAPSDALTFARLESGNRREVVAVLHYRDSFVDAVDMSAALRRPVEDPVSLFASEGYERLRSIIENAPPSARTKVEASQLTIPLDLADQHIAAGTNFPEHAADAGVEDGPFLFPKLVAPTAPYAFVDAGEGLLDYEVEPAWVTLAPLSKGQMPGHMGVILCNDYTDRATLLRHLDPWNVASGDGFATGKSFPGYLPVGNLLVIPRDYHRFVADLELRLYVNGRIRQQSPANAMVWDFDELLAQTWARQLTTWEHRGARVALPGASGTIPERTLILAGTPHGTIFDGVTLGQKLAGLGDWLLGGWGQGIATHAIERYIADAREAGIYLRSGDRVVIHVERLGIIRNVVR